MLDYLQLMNVARKIENRQQEVSEISRALKGIAREFRVPVFLLSQHKRDVEKRGGSKNLSSDLVTAGDRTDADMVIFLYRKHIMLRRETVDPHLKSSWQRTGTARPAR